MLSICLGFSYHHFTLFQSLNMYYQLNYQSVVIETCDALIFSPFLQ